MVIVSFSIAIAFAMQGAWMILPFAGLEMLVLGCALYVVARRVYCWQTISIYHDHIEVVEHDPTRHRQQTFQRAWARVKLEQARINGHPPRLTIGSHGRAVEIGGYLADGEKQRPSLALTPGRWGRRAPPGSARAPDAVSLRQPNTLRSPQLDRAS